MQAFQYQQSTPTPYKSVQDYINLPPTRALNEEIQKIFYNDQDYDQRNIGRNIYYGRDDGVVSAQLRNMRDMMLRQVRNQAQMFSDTNYKFKFPPSIFPDIPSGQPSQRLTEYQISPQYSLYPEQQTFGYKLTQQQIHQIRQQGQFEVPSNFNNIVNGKKMLHVWKINDWIVRGKNNIRNIWDNGLNTCWKIINETFFCFLEKVPECLGIIIGLPVEFFTLIFGKRSISKFYQPDYHKETILDFWADILENQLQPLTKQFGHNFIQFLEVLYPVLKIEGLKKQLIEIEKKWEWEWEWGKIREKVLNDVITRLGLQQNPDRMGSYSNSQQSSYSRQQKQQIFYNLNIQKHNLYISHLSKYLPLLNLPQPVIEDLFALLTLLNYMSYSVIMDKNSRKFKNQMLDGDYYQRLGQDGEFRKLSNSTFMAIYQKYVKFRKFYTNLLSQKKKQLNCLYQPTRTFRTTYPLLPPYEVKKSLSTPPTYTVKKFENLQIDTGTHFWKFKLYWMRLQSWTLNWIILLIGLTWAGPLGLRCLCGVEDFVWDQDCQYATGVKIEHKRETVLGKFGNVLKSIQKSREEFERVPDRGLLGKSIIRVCNLFECYIFRLIFIGIIGVLILYPIAILLFSSLCLIGIITFWLWIPLAMVVCYLFNILVFEYQIGSFGMYGRGCLLQGVPLLRLAIKLVVAVLGILFTFLAAFVFAPVVSLLYFVFLVIQRLFRTCTDCIMVCIIAKCGRTPSQDTCIARRVSGPGMSGAFYSSISQQNLYLLIAGEIQRIFVQKWIQLTRQRIQNHTKKYQKAMRYVLKPFGYDSASHSSEYNIIERNQNQLMNNFNQATQSFMRRYPNRPSNVRFTAEELEKYLVNSTKLVRNQVQRLGIQNWIFVQKNIQFKDYPALNRSLWLTIFNNGQQIFQPLEQIDTRVAFIQEPMTNNTILLHDRINYVQNTLEGNPFRQTATLSLTPLAKILLKQQPTRCYVVAMKYLCDVHGKNSGFNAWLDIKDPRSLIVAPRDVRRVRDHERYLAEEEIRAKKERNVRVIQMPLQE